MHIHQIMALPLWTCARYKASIFSLPLIFHCIRALHNVLHNASIRCRQLTHTHTHKKLPARNPNIRTGPHFYLTRFSVVWYLRGENFAKYLNKLTVCDRWMMQWAIKLIMFMSAPAKCTLLHQSRPDAVHFISISYIILICNQIRTRPNSIRKI